MSRWHFFETQSAGQTKGQPTSENLKFSIDRFETESAHAIKTTIKFDSELFLKFSEIADASWLTNNYNEAYVVKRSDTSENNSDRKVKVTLFKKNFEQKVVQISRSFQLEPGELSELDTTIQENIESGLSRDWVLTELNSIFLKYFNDYQICMSIIRFFSKLSYDAAYPIGQTVALAALSNRNISIAEEGLNAFDYWESPSSISLIENTELAHPILNKYKEDILEHLRSLINA